MVTPHAVTAVSNAELLAARHWLSTSGSRDVEVEVIAELPPSVVYRALAGRYDGGWPQFQRDSNATRRVPAEHEGAAMRSVVNASAEGEALACSQRCDSAQPASARPGRGRLAATRFITQEPVA